MKSTDSHSLLSTLAHKMCAFYEVYCACVRVNKSVSVSLYIRNKTGIKKIRKRVGVSVLLHLRPHRSMQAHRAIGTDGCVDPIAWLV